jgi:hypothetical protein
MVVHDAGMWCVVRGACAWCMVHGAGVWYVVLMCGAHCIASSTVCLQPQAVQPVGLKGLPYVPLPFYLMREMC